MNTMNERKQRSEVGRHMRRAYSLTNVVTTVMAVGVVVTVLVPSLISAAERSRSNVCLNNLRNLGVAIRSYAEQSSGYLPGPCYPAVSHDSLDPEEPGNWPILTYRLRQLQGESITDRLATCPTLAGIVPDRHFAKFQETTGRSVRPAHYALNNVGVTDGSYSDLRSTSPAYYFGATAASPDVSTDGPKAYAAIPNPSREWMIADAWYRPRFQPGAMEFQQEGPYQFEWLGEALPNFAPHQLRRPRSYTFTTSETREAESTWFRKAKGDGVTNTLYFDGHAAPSASRTYYFGRLEVLYGYRGTVNPAQISPSPESPAWHGVWR